MNDIIDFESGFSWSDPSTWIQIYTPEGVKRQISTVLDAWTVLHNSCPDNPTITSEYTLFMLWAKNALDDTLGRYIASGTLNELDEWRRRYDNAYKLCSTRNIAPKPVDMALRNDFAFLGYLTAFLGLGLAGYAIYKYKRK